MKVKYALIGASAVVVATQLAMGGVTTFNQGGDMATVQVELNSFLATVPGAALLEDWEGYGAVPPATPATVGNPVGTPPSLVLTATVDANGLGGATPLLVSSDQFAGSKDASYAWQFAPWSGNNVMAIDDGLYLKGQFTSEVLGFGLILLDVDWDTGVQTIVTAYDAGDNVLGTLIAQPAYGSPAGPPENKGNAGYTFVGFGVGGSTAPISYFEVNPVGDGLLSNNKTDLVMFDDIYVPEPHEYALVAGLGLIGFGAWRRMRKSS
jgi:hypothetical protein